MQICSRAIPCTIHCFTIRSVHNSSTACHKTCINSQAHTAASLLAMQNSLNHEPHRWHQVLTAQHQPAFTLHVTQSLSLQCPVVQVAPDALCSCCLQC